MWRERETVDENSMTNPLVTTNDWQYTRGQKSSCL
ncbi:unnamed protein product [Tetraodon nigroviridis]|uniref:(spotted green pufferfish) hypothetical protein n=1 Tax=Tetraodon nigroviridis TaxID=99883 RepID=Q4RGX3_TETNG|nr:unnamed protein product [Tetraodon nigroviridis]